MLRFIRLAVLLLACPAIAQSTPVQAQPGPAATEPARPPPPILERMHADAEALKPQITSPEVRRFLDAVSVLPRIDVRPVYYNKTTREFRTPKEWAGLDEEDQKAFQERPLSEEFYYTTKYGSPLAYARALDLVAEAGVSSFRNKRVLDFGYGGVGHLRLLAALGADCTGVDVDPLLPALYGEPQDQGQMPALESPESKGEGPAFGRVTLVHGQWPADRATREIIGGEAKWDGGGGGGYDLIISKNTLKNGYLHPEREVDPKMLVHLGVRDDEFVGTLYSNLRPGGLLMIYNLCPAPAPPDKPYIPWADGGCPFPRQMLENAGFEVIGFDVDDGEAGRAMAHTLHWDEGPGAMDLETNLFVHYTLARKPAPPK
jgi:hypothetical protein